VSVGAAVVNNEESGGRTIRRFYVTAEAIVPRSAAQVWAEREAPDHPAWGGESTWGIPLAGPTGCTVGAGDIKVIPASGPLGLRSVVLSRVIDVAPGFSTTVETITAALEHVETIRFFDLEGASTRLVLEGWFTMVCTEAYVAEAAPKFQAVGQQFLDKVAGWTPSTT
jgi:hypothetical protein